MADLQAGEEGRQQLLHNADPSVVALLEPLREAATKQELQTRVALIRLKQENVRGNATYAAKILEQACQDAATDRQTYELLAERLLELETAVTNWKDRSAGDGDDDKKGKQNDARQGEGDPQSREGGSTKEKDGTSSHQSSDAAAELQGQESARIRALEGLLEERLMAEIAHAREDREALREQERRLRERIRSLRMAVQKAPSSDRLQRALTDTHEYTAVTTADCVVCRDRPAQRAVIPCGHLCLCDACTQTLASTTAVLPYCPLCRGSLLSTLKIYTTK